MIEGNEAEVAGRAGEAIICDFHKRLDRSRISVAIIAVGIYDVAASNEDGSLSANQTERVRFSFLFQLSSRAGRRRRRRRQRNSTRERLDGWSLIRF